MMGRTRVQLSDSEQGATFRQEVAHFVATHWWGGWRVRAARRPHPGSAHAKAHLSACFTDTARRAVQVHGGIGYSWDLALHLWLRRALFDHAYLGAPSFHRERALQLFGL
jgi:alkylation response protein AidB-like acyl-CoA dehydrogenase